MKKIIFMMCAILATTMMAKAEVCSDDATPSGSFDCGKKVDLTAEPNSGYYFIKWVDGNDQTEAAIDFGNKQSIDENGKVTVSGVEVTADFSYKAIFAELGITINRPIEGKITVAYTKGGESKSKDVTEDEATESVTIACDYGTTVTLTYVPATSVCYTHSGWTVDGTSTTETTPKQFTITKPVTGSVNLDINSHTITVQTGGNGKVCVAPASED